MPYDELNEKAGLVQVWGQIGYPSVEWLVSIGALAALTVSMFGSMFPMPRIAYAMAKDGLIFRFLARVNSRGVPAWANLWLGLISALCALVFTLEVLVEMMSIGTLLAYTLVDACVLILRYQPNSSPTHPAFIEIFDVKDAESTKLTAGNGIPSGDQDEEADDWITAVSKLLKGTHQYQQVPDGQANAETGAMATKLFFSLLIFMVMFDIIIVACEDSVASPGLVMFVFFMVLVMLCHIVAISSLPQIRPKGFQTPWVPLIPSCGILINVYLMFRLSPLTLVRFSIWMILGKFYSQNRIKCSRPISSLPDRQS